MHVKLMKFLHESIITTFGRFTKSHFETILLFVVWIAEANGICRMKQDLMANLCNGMFIHDSKVNSS
jgi:hypothetical protein